MLRPQAETEGQLTTSSTSCIHANNSTLTPTSASQRSDNVTVPFLPKHTTCSLADMKLPAFRRDIRSDLSCEQLFLEPPHLRTPCTWKQHSSRQSQGKGPQQSLVDSLPRLSDATIPLVPQPCARDLRHLSPWPTASFTSQKTRQQYLHGRNLKAISIDVCLQFLALLLPSCLHLLHVFEVQQC